MAKLSLFENLFQVMGTSVILEPAVINFYNENLIPGKTC
jgi:hypothetical protein